jgi:hypothetical protein
LSILFSRMRITYISDIWFWHKTVAARWLSIFLQWFDIDSHPFIGWSDLWILLFRMQISDISDSHGNSHYCLLGVFFDCYFGLTRIAPSTLILSSIWCRDLTQNLFSTPNSTLCKTVTIQPNNDKIGNYVVTGSRWFFCHFRAFSRGTAVSSFRYRVNPSPHF